MPAIYGLTTTQIPFVNAEMSAAFFPRYNELFWPKLCGRTTSTREVEPFAVEGASPLLRLWQGYVLELGVPSWKQYVPNLLFKNKEVIRRRVYEFAQTQSIQGRPGRLGVRMIETLDYILAKRIMTGSLASSAYTTWIEDGNTYFLTLESTTTSNAVPYFSTAHTTWSGANQSNIVTTGNLPATNASLATLDVAAVAQAMLKDFALIVNMIAGWRDDKGVQIHPNFDPAKNLIMVIPPSLRVAGKLAFQSKGALVGGAPSTTTGSMGSTSNVIAEEIADVISPGLLRGCIDVESSDITTSVTPVNETDYYFFLLNDYVRPFYYQQFLPKKGNQFWPPGYDPEADAQKTLAAARQAGVEVSPLAAQTYSALVVETNLHAVGTQSQETVVDKEQFYISGRMRGNIVYGPWFTGGRVRPAAGS